MAGELTGRLPDTAGKIEIDAFSSGDENGTHEAYNTPHYCTMIFAHVNGILIIGIRSGLVTSWIGRIRIHVNAHIESTDSNMIYNIYISEQFTSQLD